MIFNGCSVRSVAVLLLASSTSATASDLDGCWRQTKVDRVFADGRVESGPSNCINVYSGELHAVACSQLNVISVYRLEDFAPGKYTRSRIDYFLGGRRPVNAPE